MYGMYSKEIIVTTPLLIWFFVQFFGVIALMVLVGRVLAIQRKVIKLLKERNPETYEKLLKPKRFESLGLSNTFFDFPIWFGDSLRTSKFFFSSACGVEDPEICKMRERARSALFIYLALFALWIFGFSLMFVIYYF